MLAAAEAVDGACARAAVLRSGRATPRLTHLVLRFTTLSDDAPRRGFVVGPRGAAVGRAERNGISVPSDATLAEYNHGAVDFEDGAFRLSAGAGGVAVRVDADEASDAWPLPRGARFAAGASTFLVERVSSETLTLRAVAGPTAGRSAEIGVDGAALGRSQECDVAVPRARAEVYSFYGVARTTPDRRETDAREPFSRSTESPGRRPIAGRPT